MRYMYLCWTYNVHYTVVSLLSLCASTMYMLLYATVCCCLFCSCPVNSPVLLSLLPQLFKKLELRAYDLTVDRLDVHAVSWRACCAWLCRHTCHASFVASVCGFCLDRTGTLSIVLISSIPSTIQLVRVQSCMYPAAVLVECPLLLTIHVSVRCRNYDVFQHRLPLLVCLAKISYIQSCVCDIVYSVCWTYVYVYMYVRTSLSVSFLPCCHQGRVDWGRCSWRLAMTWVDDTMLSSLR